MALLAAYAVEKQPGQTLEDYLDQQIFAGQKVETIAPDPADVAGFQAFMEQYKKGMPAERAAVDALR